LTRIRYEQAAPVTGRELTVGEMSEDFFILCMSRAFGEFPVTLNKKHIERLAGMSACWAQTTVNPYSILISAVNKLGSIKIWATGSLDSAEGEIYVPRITPAEEPEE
jgi:hypothetical protein